MPLLPNDSYDFEHPATEQIVRIDRWSHLWAALFGPFFVLSYAGRTGFVRALPLNMASLAIGFAALMFVPFLPGPYRLLGILVAILAIPALQSRWMIELVKHSFAREGWIVRRT